MIIEGIINKISDVLVSLIKPDISSNEDLNIEFETIKSTNNNSNSNSSNSSNSNSNSNNNTIKVHGNKVNGTLNQNHKHITRKYLNNHEFKPKDFLEISRKHSPTSSISSVYSYNSDTSNSFASIDRNSCPRTYNDITTKKAVVNVKKEIISSITNPIHFLNQILDNVYNGITIFMRYRELQKDFMTAQSQISELKLHNKYLDSHLKSVKKKRDTFSELVQELKNELQRERQARFMVEKIHSEKVERLLFEDDMKDREIDELKNGKRELEAKICKLKEDLAHYKEKLKVKSEYYRKKYNRSPTQRLYDNLGGGNIGKYESDRSTIFNEDSDYDAYSSASLCNIDFEADSKSDKSDNSSIPDKKIMKNINNSEIESDYDDDDDDYNPGANGKIEIPKDSPYYEIFNKTEEKDSLEDLEYEEDNNEYVEINFFNETTDEITHKLMSDLNATSILVDVYEKMIDRYPQATSSDWIYVTLTSFLRFFELKNMLTNNQFIQAAFKKYKKLLVRCMETPDDQLDLLNALEILCVKNQQRLHQHLRILMTLYEVELVEPYTITKWYTSKNNFDLSKKNGLSTHTKYKYNSRK